MSNKNLMIAGVIIAAIALYYFFVYKKKDALATTASKPSPFEADDTAAYNAAKRKIPADIMSWMGAYVLEMYEAGTEPEIMINGKPSKTLALIAVAGQVNANPEGKFTDRSGKRTLMPQETFDTLWSKYRAPLLAKYTSL